MLVILRDRNDIWDGIKVEMNIILIFVFIYAPRNESGRFRGIKMLSWQTTLVLILLGA